MSLATKLAKERRARLAAERLLELKQAELSAANRKLGRHALALTRQIGETQAEVATVRVENERVKSDLTVANEKIEIAERRLWHSIQTIQDGFAFFDADGKMIAANTAYLDAFGGLEEVAPGIAYPRILQLLTGEGLVDTGTRSPEDWRAFMAGRWMSPSPEPVVIRWWNDQYIKLIDQRGHGGDMVSLALNITATVRYEAKLKKARKRAEAASHAKSAFLANMSHEIRTPMNGVVGMAELLSESGLTDEQRLYAETIRNSGEALLVIINDVLDYSKIEAGKLVLHSEPFDLERCIHEVVMLLQPAARDKGLAMMVDYDLFLPTRFIGDPGRLRQVMTNLAGNAAKFTRTGHVLISVTGVPGAEGGDCAVHVTVEDTGIGIPAGKVEHVFGEFNQVDGTTNRQFEGTGLGLAISRRLVGMMGGAVWVDSTEGKGSCFGFRVTLPVAGGPLPAPPRLPETLRHVVIADDHAANREILEKQLVQLGLRVTACGSGAEALESLGGGADLVISAHNMPEMNGLELAAAMRAGPAPEVPILLISENPGHARNDPAVRHVQGVLQKPYPRAHLFAQLTEIAGAGPEGAAGPGLLVATESGPGGRAAVAGTRLMRVLAAEDNKTNQLVFRKMVKDMQLELEFAANGREAVAAFRSFRPDLIFMDISMPHMDGKSATQEIRKLEAESGAHVPIVAMTAHAMEGDSEGILAAGLDHFLTKPLRKALIHERILAACPPDTLPPLADQAAAS